MLQEIKDAIRRWQAESQIGSGDVLKDRVAREIEPYLGYYAVQSLVGRVSENNDNLLSTIEPVLARFLGSRAASSLVSRVVDSVILKGA